MNIIVQHKKHKMLFASGMSTKYMQSCLAEYESD